MGFKGISGKFQRYVKGVSRKFLEFPKKVFRMLQGKLKGVSMEFLLGFKGV